MNKPEPMSDKRIVELRDKLALTYTVWHGDAVVLSRAIEAERNAQWATQLEEAERDASEMRAQLRHLIDDITHCLNPSHPNKRYIKPGYGLIFSNMVNASIDLVERADAAITKEQQP